MRCSRCARGEVKGSKVSIDKRGVEGTQLSVNGPRRKAVAQVAYTWVDAGTEEGRALIRGEGTGGGRVSKRLGIEEEAIQDRDEAKGRVHYILGKRGHKGGGAYGCAENTMATTAGRSAVPTEHVGGTLSRIDYGVIPQDPDHIR